MQRQPYPTAAAARVNRASQAGLSGDSISYVASAHEQDQRPAAVASGLQLPVDGSYVPRSQLAGRPGQPRRLMARPASLPCPSCEGMLSRVADTREDPEHPLEPAIWRIHECQDCGARYASAQHLVSVVEADARLAHLARERYQLAQAGRRPDRFRHPVGGATR
jgi:hypothetical protein